MSYGYDLTVLGVAGGYGGYFVELHSKATENDTDEFIAEFDANARLIAAAPDLFNAALAAKRLLTPELDEPGRTVFWALVDAVNKASGK